MLMYILITLLSLIILYIFSLALTGIKITLHNFFGYTHYQYLWVKYSIFYTLVFGIILGTSLFINSGRMYLSIIIFESTIVEAWIFYKRYYDLESKKKYSIFLLFSTVFGGMTITTLLIILFTILAIFFGIEVTVGT